MNGVKITCVEHNGIFTIPVKRGRKPTKCNPKNPCSRATGVDQKQETTAHAFKDMTISELRAYATQIGMPESELKTMARAVRDATGWAPDVCVRKAIRQWRVQQAPVLIDHNAPESRPEQPAEKPAKPSAGHAGLDIAKETKQKLTELSWACKGRKEGDLVVLTCARGEETLTLTWDRFGKCVQQDYNVGPLSESLPKGVAASMGKRLNFDPMEITDSELVTVISGMNIKWLNTLSRNFEAAIVGPGTVRIEHRFDHKGNENPLDRVVHFIEQGGRGYRSFRLSALEQVG